jgi:acetyl-CoA C-acetyltransferase
LQAALKKAGLASADLELVEINEAFAGVALHAGRMLFDSDTVVATRVNVNGGAVALGHPIGATGARLVVTLLHELRRRGGGLGAAALCGGGGQGDALVVRAA